MIVRILLSLIIFIFVIGCEEDESFTFRFRGTVTNESGTPIENAVINLKFNNVLWKYGPLETTETNSEGKFRLSHVVDNWYINDACVNNMWRNHYLTASANGYRGTSRDSLKCTEYVQIFDFTLEKF